MSNTLNVYPHTEDMKKNQPDLVLSILEGARKRYKRYGTADTYIASGQVCAIGAVAREAGMTPKKYDESGIDEITDMKPALLAAKIDKHIAKAAKDAIKLLDSSATRLYKDSFLKERPNGKRWSGPLEWLNQELIWPDAKKAVISCYDDAITRRQAKLLAAA